MVGVSLTVRLLIVSPGKTSAFALLKDGTGYVCFDSSDFALTGGIEGGGERAPQKITTMK